MKKHQFEEITAALSIIIALLSYEFNIDWLFCTFVLKSIWDVRCAFKYARIESEKLNKKQNGKD